MTWHDYLALTFFGAAAIMVARRAYRAVFRAGKQGCNSGCGACAGNAAAAPKGDRLVSIGPPEVG